MSLSGTAHYWAQMKRLTRENGAFTAAEIDGESNRIVRDTIKLYVTALLRQGDIERKGQRAASAGRFAAPLYAVTHQSARAPVQKKHAGNGDRGQRQQQLWNAMRALPAFTMGEIWMIASTEEVQVSPATSRNYIGALVKASLVLVIKPKSGGLQGWRYRLKPSANTGPKALVIERKGGLRVYDPNRQQYLGESGRIAA